ncbi:MAG: methyl-accepting chemotaxis protein [Desulfobacterales bacterium]
MKRNSITTKFITIVSALTIILMAGLATAVISAVKSSQSKEVQSFIDLLKTEKSNEEQMLNNSIIRKGESIANLMAQNASSLIVGYDFETLEQTADNSAKDPDILFVSFYDKDKKILTKKVPENKDVNIVSRPIKFDKETVGFVEVGLNFSNVKTEMENLSTRIEKMIDNTKNAETKAVKSIVVMLVCSGLISVIILCGVIYLSLSRIVSRPIKSTIEIVKDIAQGEGDLTKRLEIKSEDEVGELSKWFNVFMKKLQGIINDIADNANMLRSSSANLSELSGKMSEGAGNMSGKSNTAASAAEKMSGNMNSVAAKMGQAADNVNMVANAAEEMTATINEIAQNSEKASHITGGAVIQTQSTSSKVDELGSAANEIGKVVEAITEISEQVNLLALNATIEAARAGEAGKGFAVVANEIKDLAKQTAEATQEIKEKIGAIQGATDATVMEIDQISKVINNVNEIVSSIATSVEEQSVTTREIAGNVAQTSQGIQEVNENVAASSAAADEIANDIVGVSRSVDEMSTNSSQVAMSAEELAGLAKKLNEMVGKFRI